MTKARLLGNLISQGQPLLEGFVTQSYVDNKVTQLINGAPGTLDTLKEIADQLAADESAVGAITTALAGKANSSSLSTVATSGSYSDLTNKPTIPTVPTLATVATSGSYSDLTNKPVIPTVPTLATVATSGSYEDLANKPTLFSGSYTDLTNKPTGLASTGKAIAMAIVFGG